MLVETDSDVEADANSETFACVRSNQRHCLKQTLNSRLILIRWLKPMLLLLTHFVKAEAETLVDFEVNSDTETD